jgi:AcrR family transcriptional regulator
MQSMNDRVKQPYQSRVRAEAARQTRRLIREAATRLFVEQGVAATTMRQIAAEAGVAERTVYTVFPSKTALFKEVLDVAVVGDEAPVAVAQRPEFEALLVESNPVRAAHLFADLSVRLLERAGDLLMTATESAGADPELREIVDQGDVAMTANMASVARAWERRGLLRADLDADQAGTTLYVIGSPHVHHLLRRRRGWSVDGYRRWLADTLTRTLLRE